MNIAFVYESVLPERGGCETYIADLARRLAVDRHETHLYACRWDAKALPQGMRFHPIAPVGGPRFLRPWRFAGRALRVMAGHAHDATIGFDKTFGQDILYPLGGLHSASFDHNLRKHKSKLTRGLTRLLKTFDLAHWSFKRLERTQYLGPYDSQIVVNSDMVRRHFAEYLGISEDDIRVVPSAIDPGRFVQHDRLRLRAAGRERWKIAPEHVVGLFVGKNPRLKGLPPLLNAMRRLIDRPEFNGRPPRLRLLVCGNDDTRPFEREARRLGIRDYVRFAGDYGDIRSAFFSADFLVHPTFYDPCSLVVLEALACDLPVITSRFNGAAELLHPLQEGFVIDDPHDAERLAWSLLQMLDPARRRLCAEAARRTSAQWNFERHYQQMLEVFHDVAARKRRRLSA
ncbi:MAG: glycosyltransferase family 4 protein [Gemmataceae bacterium]